MARKCGAHSFFEAAELQTAEKKAKIATLLSLQQRQAAFCRRCGADGERDARAN